MLLTYHFTELWQHKTSLTDKKKKKKQKTLQQKNPTKPKKPRESLFTITTEKSLQVLETQHQRKNEREFAGPYFCKYFGLEELLPP